jgi:hypothetical protein
VPGCGVAAGDVAEVDVDADEQAWAQAFLAALDGLHAPVLDEAFEQADDAVCAAEEVFGHGALGEHAGGGVEQVKLVFDPGQVGDPGGDGGGGVVAERVEVDQVEAAFGLGRR